MVLISAGKTLSDRPSVYEEQGFQPTCVMKPCHCSTHVCNNDVPVTQFCFVRVGLSGRINYGAREARNPFWQLGQLSAAQ